MATDMAIVTTENWETAPKLSNGMSFNDNEWPASSRPSATDQWCIRLLQFLYT